MGNGTALETEHVFVPGPHPGAPAGRNDADPMALILEKIEHKNNAKYTGKTLIVLCWRCCRTACLAAGCPPIVCFNYDRCIEHYLTCELMRAYTIERKEAAELVKRLRIWHPYGTIAPLDTQELNGIAYGDNEAIGGRSFQLAARTQTFTEKNQDGVMIEAIRERIRAAETVVFLGFGYYPQNLPGQLLPVSSGAKMIKNHRFEIGQAGRLCSRPPNLAAVLGPIKAKP